MFYNRKNLIAFLGELTSFYFKFFWSLNKKHLKRLKMVGKGTKSVIIKQII